MLVVFIMLINVNMPFNINEQDSSCSAELSITSVSESFWSTVR